MLFGSPFDAKNTVDFTFFNCSGSDEIPYDFNLNPISCLSGLSYAVFASSSSMVNGILSSRCELVKTVSVPMSSESYSWDLDLRNDLRLVWKKPNCKKCELNGGGCQEELGMQYQSELEYRQPCVFWASYAAFVLESDHPPQEGAIQALRPTGSSLLGPLQWA
ncbi:RING-H2 finger protein ATL20-like [Cucumis melo var. makuwa]|uniref:RING-type E3 ubiquitin transferase n=1 Tax=Cucumis melo var. makuwa TaxID=1194695 RepID=A0A5A7U5J2_CUCMM|nr:RING-H2 finger protein ATL20-like [Cucumis melo var. makuwa]TYK03160.1 RING-H2 finger protein ATL20-like [Cucumis melo var. makuwa]